MCLGQYVEGVHCCCYKHSGTLRECDRSRDALRAKVKGPGALAGVVCRKLSKQCVEAALISDGQMRNYSSQGSHYASLSDLVFLYTTYPASLCCGTTYPASLCCGDELPMCGRCITSALLGARCDDSIRACGAGVVLVAVKSHVMLQEYVRTCWDSLQLLFWLVLRAELRVSYRLPCMSCWMKGTRTCS